MSAVSLSDAPQFRPMRWSELPRILEIEQLAYEFPWTEGIFKDCLRVGYLCRVIEADGAVRGYGVLSVAAGECHLLNLCIEPAEHGRGLGRSLLQHLLGLARDYGADTAFLEVRPSNKRALKLYTDEGFNSVGVRRGYYPATKGREDALILARVL
jgi:ribosomal-protein-alanine N-acetyltransferase